MPGTPTTEREEDGMPISLAHAVHTAEGGRP
ncbi:hypothetical protein SAMN05216483_6425 [Streptomyces sp. 2131.1]|nr:hypothetical protein SAMN05216483_6425 [Streptomyces sp. 2131.1]